MSKKAISRVKFDKETHFDRIKASFIDDEIVLSDKELKLKRRWMTAFSLMRDKIYSSGQAAKYLHKTENISIAQAYRDVNNALALFGDIHTVNTEGVKIILREAYWRLYQMAVKDGNRDQQRKALDSYKELFDFDRNLDDEKLAEKIEAHIYKITVPRDVAKALREQLNKGVIDFNQYPAEDVEYEEISDDE